MSDITQDHGGETLTHVLVEADDSARATILMFPTVMGVTDLELGFASDLATRRCNVLVIDLYGRRFTGAERAEAMDAMNTLKADRTALRDRLVAVLDHASQLPSIDRARLATMGFCFGGLCALDLARTGRDIALTAAFHGLLDPPGLPPQAISGKVALFHGWADKLAHPDAVVAIGEELTAAGADWQLHAFGGVGHAFTNPGAAPAEGFGYHEPTARRSFAIFDALLDETFGVA